MLLRSSFVSLLASALTAAASAAFADTQLW